MKTTFPNTHAYILWISLDMCITLPLRLSCYCFASSPSSRSHDFSSSSFFRFSFCYTQFFCSHCTSYCYFITRKHAKMAFKWKENNNSNTLTTPSQHCWHGSFCIASARAEVVESKTITTTQRMTYFHLFNRCYIYSFVFFYLSLTLSFFILFFAKRGTIWYCWVSAVWCHGC